MCLRGWLVSLSSTASASPLSSTAGDWHSPGKFVDLHSDRSMALQRLESWLVVMLVCVALAVGMQYCTSSMSGLSLGGCSLEQIW